MKNNINITGRLIALLSFVIGTMLLAFYLYFGESTVQIHVAILFIVIAFILNTILFAVILGATLLNKTNRIEGLKTLVIMLCNIPISILYFYMVITFPGHKLLL
ncbi:hypothetical protein DFQ05_2136 [Winogradskyella wandonensis]|uniref:LIVCS family branched-chain amino acid:cation transporter n=1 Tax=Winogradskyella wandonensis TaxID=1442586 RepID=A0A4V2PTK4_9FLAO|nr:hypothetical protein [Winogradskyella wandonensis]TCK66851.1 hypothetical protein DFQ05_2136 [Winogradskyella wandonensis]